jgi:hypothetical protein
VPLPATSQYIGVTTIGGHTSRAVDFQARTDVWMTLGKPTPWTGTDPLRPGNPAVSDTTFPPLPNPLTTALLEPVVAKKATLHLVVPDNTNGTIYAYGLKWRIVTPQDAITLGARHVAVITSFDYNEAPTHSVDSYLIQNEAIGATVLHVKSADGYQVGDEIKCGGIDGQETTVTAVNTSLDTITIADPLTALLYRGTYITNLTNPTAFAYRQVGVLSRVTANLGAPGQLITPMEYITASLLEYLYNTLPIPRELNRRDGPTLILTF